MTARAARGLIRIAALVAFSLSGAASLLAQGSPKRALTFAVDTTTYGNLVESSLSSLWLEVRYDGHRGRIDVLDRVARPTVRMGWLALSPPRLAQGDYFLFDSSRLVHVRPGSRTFTTYPLKAVSYNFQGERDRWPFFRRPRAGAEVARSRVSGAAQRVDIGSYWHSEWVRDTSCWGAAFGRCLVRELARGRGEATTVPPALIGIIRWIGPTLSLAAIGGRDTLVGKPIRATMVNQWISFGGDSVVTVTTARFVTGLRFEATADSLFRLPRGFREVTR